MEMHPIYMCISIYSSYTDTEGETERERERERGFTTDIQLFLGGEWLCG